MYDDADDIETYEDADDIVRELRADGNCPAPPITMPTPTPTPEHLFSLTKQTRTRPVPQCVPWAYPDVAYRPAVASLPLFCFLPVLHDGYYMPILSCPVPLSLCAMCHVP